MRLALMLLDCLSQGEVYRAMDEGFAIVPMSPAAVHVLEHRERRCVVVALYCRWGCLVVKLRIVKIGETVSAFSFFPPPRCSLLGIHNNMLASTQNILSAVSSHTIVP